MFKQDRRSRQILSLLFAAGMLAGFMIEPSVERWLTFATGNANGNAHAAPQLAVPHNPPEPFQVSQSALELIWIHPR